MSDRSEIITAHAGAHLVVLIGQLITECLERISISRSGGRTEEADYYRDRVASICNALKTTLDDNNVEYPHITEIN